MYMFVLTTKLSYIPQNVQLRVITKPQHSHLIFLCFWAAFFRSIRWRVVYFWEGWGAWDEGKAPQHMQCNANKFLGLVQECMHAAHTKIPNKYIHKMHWILLELRFWKFILRNVHIRNVNIIVMLFFSKYCGMLYIPNVACVLGRIQNCKIFYLILYTYKANGIEIICKSDAYI